MDVKAEVIVAGMYREGDPDFDPSLVGNAVAGLRAHVVGPELRRRGAQDVDPTTIDRALVVFGVDRGTSVYLGDETDFVAFAGRDEDVVEPRDVFVGHIVSVWPDGIDPDAGWTGYVTAQQGLVLVCDFRRERQSLRPLLARSQEFLDAAELALSRNLTAPAIEHLNTAAELALIVLIRLGGEKVGRDHTRRRQWLRREVELCDVPQEFADAVERLATSRNPARYAEGSITDDATTIGALHTTVADLLGYATAKVA